MQRRLITADFTLSPGSWIEGRYEVLRIIGSGAVGTVAKVIDHELDGEYFAFKVLHQHLASDMAVLKRFQNEVLIARQLSHPNIVRIYDFFTTSAGLHIISMEYVEGCNVRQIAESYPQKKMPFEEAMYVLFRTAQGLLFAHERNIIHRDLKPDNVLLGANGSVELSDFGLAENLDCSAGLTRTGETIGSPTYMAPEQFLGQPTDERTDIYSFGILAFELLAGRPPFDAPSCYELADKHIRHPLTSQELAATTAPAWIQELLLSCTSKAPEARPSSFSHILGEIEQNAPGLVKTSGVGVQAMKRFQGLQRRRSPLRFSAATAVVFYIVTIAITTAALHDTGGKRRLLAGLIKYEMSTGHDTTPLKTIVGLPLLSVANGSAVFSDTGDSLTESLQKGSFDDVSFLTSLYLAGYLDVGFTDEEGNNLVHFIVRHNWVIDTDLYDPLMASQINRSNKRGETPLLAAIRAGNVAMANELLNLGADPDIPDEEKTFPVHEILRRGLGDVLLASTLIKSRGLQVNIRDQQGRTPLHLAVELANEGATRRLLEYRADPDARDIEGRTPLMLAAKLRSPRKENIARLLRDTGASTRARDHEGRTLADYLGR